MLWITLDQDHDGFISYEEFVHGMRGPMNTKRKDAVCAIFEALDLDGDGVLTPHEFRLKMGSGLAAKKGSGAGAMDFGFLAAFGDGIGIEQFCKYYDGVSRSVDSDEMFLEMLKSAWGFATIPHRQGAFQRRFHTSNHPRPDPAPGSAAAALEKVKKQLVQKPFAASGIWSTLQMAKDAAEKSEGRRRPVSMDDPAIVRFTKEAGLSSDEVAALKACYDDDSGANFELLLQDLQGAGVETRRRMLRRIFDRLDIDRDQVLTVDDFPDIEFGNGVTPRDMLRSLDIHEADGAVTFEEFAEFYLLLGVSVQSDREFERLVETSWKLRTPEAPGQKYTTGRKTRSQFVLG